jgi:hypothetical protein
MANYLFAYHGGQQPEGQEEFVAVMKAWSNWLTEFGTSVVDAGNPIGSSLTVESDGTITNNGGSNPVSGYGIFKASSSDEAAEIAKKCPILAAGGSVEFAEIFDLSQSA